MWSWNCLGYLLTVLLFTSARAQGDNGTTDTDLSGIDTFSSIADKLNCTRIDVHHRGIKIEEGTRFRPTISAVGITTSEDPDVYKNGNGSKLDDGVTLNPEMEVTKKPNTDEEKTKLKRSTEDVKPSKNDTGHHDSPVMEKYPSEMPELKEQPNETNCFLPFDDAGEQYNWYQIIIDNGGVPGKVNATRLTPNVTRVLNPCERPIRQTEPQFEDLLYKYELIEYEKVYRREEAFLRFAGTDSEFVDVHGHFVWSPPGYPRRYYRLEYREDDTGFYIKVHRGQKCEFSQNPVSIKCDRPVSCFCDEDGKENCHFCPYCRGGWSGGVVASLIGG